MHDDFRVLMEELSLQYVYALKYLSAYELAEIEHKALSYGWMLEDVDVFSKTGRMPS